MQNLFYLWFASLLILPSGCDLNDSQRVPDAGSPNGHPPPTSTPTTPTTTPSPPKKFKEELLLKDLTEAELEGAFKKFKDEKIKKIGDKYAVNNYYHAYFDAPHSTLIHGYTKAPPTEIYLTMKLPQESIRAVPKSVIDELKKTDVDAIEIFFTPQKYDGYKIKTHYWVYDHIPASFTGTIFNDSVDFGVYDYTDGKFRKDAIGNPKLLSQIDMLKTHQNVHIHDDNISPDNGMIEGFDTKKLPTYFFTLAIYKRRAAITLHWLQHSDGNKQIKTYLDDKTDTTVQDFIGRFGTGIGSLKTLLDAKKAAKTSP